MLGTSCIVLNNRVDIVAQRNRVNDRYVLLRQKQRCETFPRDKAIVFVDIDVAGVVHCSRRHFYRRLGIVYPAEICDARRIRST